MKDKVKHFVACAAIAVITMAVCLPFAPMYGFDAGIAAIIVFIVAASKELIWDKWLNNGYVDYYDFFWGICGGWAGIFVWKIIEAIL